MYKFDNIEEMDQFLKIHKVPSINQAEIGSSIVLQPLEEISSVI